MIKVHIQVPCQYCDGEAYLPYGEASSYTGETYIRYFPCHVCHGSGEQAKWINLREFVEMLSDEAAKDPMAPDWQELARKMPTSQYADRCDAAGI